MKRRKNTKQLCDENRIYGVYKLERN